MGCAGGGWGFGGCDVMMMLPSSPACSWAHSSSSQLMLLIWEHGNFGTPVALALFWEQKRFPVIPYTIVITYGNFRITSLNRVSVHSSSSAASSRAVFLCSGAEFGSLSLSGVSPSYACAAQCRGEVFEEKLWAACRLGIRGEKGESSLGVPCGR